jgi:hypothetical protein
MATTRRNGSDDWSKTVGRFEKSIFAPHPDQSAATFNPLQCTKWAPRMLQAS